MATQKKERPVTLSLDAFLKKSRKEFGERSVGTAAEVHIPAAHIPTGCDELDADLNGGWHRGKIHELWGLEASGKSLLTYVAIANCQRQGDTAAFIDAEMTFDPGFAAGLGVDVDKLILMKPDYGEQALEFADSLARTGEVALIVIDSVSALTPKAEIEGTMEQNHVGLQARMMGQACRKLTPIAAKSHTAMIFINQIREKVGVLYGNPNTTSGGNALKYYASIRMEVSLVKEENNSPKYDEMGKQCGHRMRVKVVKSKVSAKVKTPIEFNIDYTKGIDNDSSAFNICIKKGIIRLEKGHYYLGDSTTHFAYGKPKAMLYFMENPTEFGFAEHAEEPEDEDS